MVTPVYNSAHDRMWYAIAVGMAVEASVMRSDRIANKFDRRAEAEIAANRAAHGIWVRLAQRHGDWNSALLADPTTKGKQ